MAKTEIIRTQEDGQLNETNLGRKWYRKYYPELTKSILKFKGLQYFIKPRLLFGEGVESIVHGFVKPYDMVASDNEITAKTSQPQDLTEEINNQIKLVYGTEYNKNEYLSYFKDAASMAEYFDNFNKHVATSTIINKNDFFLALFGKESLLESLTSAQKLLVEKLKTETWTSNITTDFKNKSSLEIVEKINQLSDDLREPNKLNSISGKYHASVDRSNQILVLELQTYRQIQKELADKFRADYYNLEGFFDVILVNGIKQAFIFDKDLIQLYPRLEEVNTKYDGASLKYKKWAHIWETIGTLKHAAAKVLTLKD